MRTLHLLIIGIGIALSIGILIYFIEGGHSVSSTTRQSQNETVQNTPEITSNSKPVAIPVITLSSDKATAGNEISIMGSGFTQSAPVKITLPDNSVADIKSSSGTYASTLGVSGNYGSDNTHFGYPEGVALDSLGDIYVADRGNERVQKFSSTGTYLSTLGVSGRSGVDDAHFNTPIGIAVDNSGNVYVADTYNHRVQKFSGEGRYLLTLGVTGKAGTDNAHFSYPEGVAVDNLGNVYVADTYNHRIQKFSSDGTYLYTLGMPGTYGTDNAHFCYPASVAVDSKGGIYVADSGNNRIQKFSSSGQYISTFGVSGPYMASVGMSSKSYADDIHLNIPESVALDSAGNVYVADTYDHRIQEFSGNGTYLSTLGVSGKPGSDNTRFSYPTGVTLDSSGNIYVADFDNNRVQIFTPSGSFEKQVTVPPVPLGTYAIYATDGKNSATATLSLVSQMPESQPVVTTPVSVNQGNPPAFYILEHGISVKDAIQKSQGPANASNTFALFLLSNIVQKDRGNIFFSPYSLSDAFSMQYEGARNQTESEMQSVFGFADRQTQREYVKELDSKLNNPDANYTLKIANALWVQKNFTILQQYYDALQKYYSANAQDVDFVNDPEGSRHTINSWVAGKTDQKITEVLPKDSIQDKTRVILTDAIYFKGTWRTQFNESQTVDSDFTLSDNDTVKVPMMHVETGFKYLEDGNLKILDMPYSGGLSMMVILPKDKDLAHVGLLSSDKLDQWRRELAVQEVSVHMPKFTLHTKYKLKDSLSEMGMPSAFDRNLADFSGITGTKNLYIDNVYHDAFVDVNEKGTEAAAATAIVDYAVMCGGTCDVQPIEFNADHPFLFLIYDDNTGLVLFLGEVVDPTAG